VVDDERVGSVETNDTTQIPIEAWTSHPAVPKWPQVEQY